MPLTRRHFAASAIAALASTAVIATPIEQASSFERIRRTGRLRLGVVPGASPYSVKDLATGDYRGFCVDLGRDLARHLRVEVTWVETRWGNAALDLQSDKIDAHLGLAPTPQRRQSIAFTDALVDNVYTVVARQGVNPRRWADLDRPELTVAVDLGSSHDQIAARLLTHARVLRFESLTEATLAVGSGRADAQILAVLSASVLLAKRPELGHLVVPTPLEALPTCIGLRRQEDPRLVIAVNEWIAEARAAGRVRSAIGANLRALAGVSLSDLPPQIRF
ncbi:transporter substrate-binding domain-containing protein [Roseateles sp.]|uniref:transporter substrate-binding domain-containing protein n=1 Tax=Roseateles sp. TaxID=1971397 RepID=UPI0031E375E1